MSVSFGTVHCSVVRRIGGLEMELLGSSDGHFVVRRIGGLENSESSEVSISTVVRRIGGLETGPPPS